jgi:hypothetical protein
MHYSIKIRFYKSSSDKTIEVYQEEKEFSSGNPINDRLAVFNYYDNFVNSLLSSMDKENASDQEAREILEPFFDKGITYTWEFQGSSDELNESRSNGIGVFIHIDGDETCIHGIGSFFDPSIAIFGLQEEYETLKSEEVDFVKIQLIKFTFYNEHEYYDGYREEEPGKYSILVTPFNWSNKENALWWVTSHYEQTPITKKEPSTIEELIANGEDYYTEFKPALVYNFKTGQGGIGIKKIIAKAICAFANSEGGRVLIGVSDDKMITGLEHDFSLTYKKDKHDYLKLELDQLLRYFFPEHFKRNVHGEFYSIDNREILIVNIKKSNRPIFLTDRDNKEFYIRTAASSQQLYDPEQIALYSMDKWGQSKS